MKNIRPLIPLLAIISGIAGLFCQLALGRLIGGSIFMPSLAVLAIALWFPIMAGHSRFIIGSGAGFLLDSLGLPPFGSTIILFYLLASAAWVLERVFANRESGAGQTAVYATLLLLALFAPPLTRILAAHLTLTLRPV